MLTEVWKFVSSAVEWKLTLDGLMTLIAGVIAFTAVIIQIRSSSKQLQEQMKAQRGGQREEQERQKQSVATAILFEIDSIYAQFVDFAEDRSLLPESLGTGFPVFTGNAMQLGLLDHDTVAAVVRFYGEIKEHFLTAQALAARLRSIADKQASFSLGDPRLGTILSIQERQKRNAQDGIAQLGPLARDACSRLCAVSRVPRGSIRALGMSSVNSD